MTFQVKVEYFNFEQDFMEDNIRCIPMVVRFKLDRCGIKLKLKEWSKMTVHEREQLAALPVESRHDIHVYTIILKEIIHRHTGEDVTPLPAHKAYNYWNSTERLPEELKEKLEESNMSISPTQWRSLTTLQRFALVKLTRPGHENKNFPKAMREFGLA